MNSAQVQNVEIDMGTFAGITQDSRKVQPGYLFAAIPGTQTDGRLYIDKAIENGARGILTLTGSDKPKAASKTLWLEDENPRRALAHMAAAFYGNQPDRIVAVTGTNGKTSTVIFVQQIWRSLGYKTASLGTLGLKSDIAIETPSHDITLTTPDTVQLHEDLSALDNVGISHLAMEASSHGLDQFRLDGVSVKAAAFTNFTRDHLDYHKTEEAYLEAKMRLFSDLVISGGAAVLNADIEEFETIRSVCADKELNILSYGENGEHIKLKKCEPVTHGLQLFLDVFGESYDLTLPLAGAFQAENVMAALGLVLSEKPDDKAFQDGAVKALKSLKGAPGRLDLVSGHPKGAAVYVDYAHTPDALETVLKSLRPHTKGRLICLFGCGGDRDAGKRPEMGRAVHEYADIGILTDDNPRGEDPAIIRAQAKEGAPNTIEIEGRDNAIKHGIQMLENNDVFVIAGKGHEQGQTIQGKTYPFCDRTQAIQAIQEL